VKPKFQEGQSLRVRRAPAWDVSAQDALGEVREYAEANQAGTGWEVEVWLEVDGESSLWILPIQPGDDRCIAPDGTTQDEAYAAVILRKGVDPAGALETTRDTLAGVFGGHSKFSTSEVRSDTLTSSGSSGAMQSRSPKSSTASIE
jgi:hypothetical protein